MSKKILSIETSSSVCGISVIENDIVLSNVEDNTPRRHIENLPKFLKISLEKSNKRINQIDAIAVSIGPGSFTGLRIGLGFAKGLAFSHSLPIIPVPSLLSLAFSINEDKPPSGVLHSHSRKIFYQEFDWKNNIPMIRNEPILDVIDNYINNSRIGFYAGCRKFFEKKNSIKEANHSSISVGLLASKNYAQWIKHKPYNLIPEYIAPFEIKKREKK